MYIFTLQAGLLSRIVKLCNAFATSETSQAANQWDQIDDFKWLKVEASPNFSLLAEAERVKDEVWREKVLGGGDDRELDDILKLVTAR
jgi:hypothetical protein